MDYQYQCWTETKFRVSDAGSGTVNWRIAARKSEINLPVLSKRLVNAKLVFC